MATNKLGGGTALPKKRADRMKRMKSRKNRTCWQAARLGPCLHPRPAVLHLCWAELEYGGQHWQQALHLPSLVQLEQHVLHVLHVGCRGPERNTCYALLCNPSVIVINYCII